MTSAFPSQRLKIRFLPAVPGTDAKGSSIAAKFWYDQAKIQADIALQANETKVDKAGSVMTGPLTLFGDPTSPLVASTKQYADTKVARSGDSMSGFLTLSADPTATLHAATKNYADTKVAKAGDTMTGTLVLNANPIQPLDAAPKQYVDGAISIIGGGIFQPKDPDLSSIAANTTSATWLFRRGDGDWAPVNIGDGLSFDTVTGDLESVGGGGGGGTGDVSASDGPVPNQLAMWIGSVTIKGINIGAGLQLQTVGTTQSLVALGQVQVSGTPVAGQFAKWTDDHTIQGANLDGDLTALAALTGVNTIYYRSGVDTWSPVVVGTGMSFVGGTLAATGAISIVPTPAAGQTVHWASPTSVKGVQVHTAAPTAPSTPTPGNFWYDTTTGVLAVSVDDGNSQQWIQVAPSAGNIASNSSFVSVRKFTANDIYIPTPGTQFIQVEVIGGGGSGAVAQSNATSTMQGAGGGSGGYSRSVLTAAQIGASQPITIGAGGPASASNGNNGTASSFGGLCIANGGFGGGQAITDVVAPIGGSGAVAGVGDIAIPGSTGGWGFYGTTSTAALCESGNGAPGPLGGGGASVGSVGAPGPNAPASGYGGGGTGGSSHFSGAITNGGAGAPGVVIVTEYNIGVGQQGPQGLAGGVTTPLTPQGRLTLQAATPVMTTTQSAKTTIFYSPYCGNQVPIWNGTSWATTSFNELSAVTTDTTKSPAAIGASKVNDWFVWNDAGTLRLGHGPDWTNDTTRAATLTRLNGIWVNTAAITNGPGVNLGTYVGTTRSDGASQLGWMLGGAGVGGAVVFLAVFNAYNRVPISVDCRDTASSWTVTGVPPVALNGSNVNRINWVDGLKEVSPYVGITTYCSTALAVALGINSASSASGAFGISQGGAVNSSVFTSLGVAPLLGYNFVQGLQANYSGGAGAMYGSGTGAATTSINAQLML